MSSYLTEKVPKAIASIKLKNGAASKGWSGIKNSFFFSRPG